MYVKYSCDIVLLCITVLAAGVTVWLAIVVFYPSAFVPLDQVADAEVSISMLESDVVRRPLQERMLRRRVS